MTDNPVPMPLRAAAGLAAFAIDEARRLPRRLVGLPVLAVSGAMQASLRVQQSYAELAVRGDELLAQLRPAPAEETPRWARFDEDETDETYRAGADGDAAVPGPVGTGPADTAGGAGVRDDAGHPTGQRAEERADERELVAALPLPDYDRLTLGQLRARLRRLSLEQVELLAEHERASTHRAPYLTVLENRLTVLRGE